MLDDVEQDMMVLLIILIWILVSFVMLYQLDRGFQQPINANP